MHYSEKYLHQRITVTIDRPLGSIHPDWGYVYPLNYGYIEGALAPDGEYLDAYILGRDISLETFEGICIAVIERIDDDDDKLIIAPEGIDFTDEEIRVLTHFQEQYFESEILR